MNEQSQIKESNLTQFRLFEQKIVKKSQITRKIRCLSYYEIIIPKLLYINGLPLAHFHFSRTRENSTKQINRNVGHTGEPAVALSTAFVPWLLSPITSDTCHIENRHSINRSIGGIHFSLRMLFLRWKNGSWPGCGAKPLTGMSSIVCPAK